MSYTLQEIGQSILAERERQRLTQRVFATKTGATQARISKIENGETDARLSTIIEFARTLDLELMFVPRQKVPAVKAILAQQALSSADKAARSALDRLIALIVQLIEQFPNNTHLKSLDRTTRELTNFRLTRDKSETISKAIDALRLIQKTPALASTLDTLASELRRLRNEIANNILDDNFEPRPAYRLDEAEDE